MSECPKDSKSESQAAESGGRACVPNSQNARPASPQAISEAVHFDELLTPAEVAARVRVHEDTLARWRRAARRGGAESGPPFLMIGRSVRYHKAGLRAWLAGKEIQP